MVTYRITGTGQKASSLNHALREQVSPNMLKLCGAPVGPVYD